MVDYEKHFRMYCEENSLPIKLSFDIPEGYETAIGTFDPTVNTLFINKGCHSVFALVCSKKHPLQNELAHADEHSVALIAPLETNR